MKLQVLIPALLALTAPVTWLIGQDDSQKPASKPVEAASGSYAEASVVQGQNAVANDSDDNDSDEAERSRYLQQASELRVQAEELDLQLARYEQDVIASAMREKGYYVEHDGKLTRLSNRAKELRAEAEKLESLAAPSTGTAEAYDAPSAGSPMVTGYPEDFGYSHQPEDLGYSHERFGVPVPAEPGYSAAEPGYSAFAHAAIRPNMLAGVRMSEADAQAVDLSRQYRSMKDEKAKAKLRDKIAALIKNAFDEHLAERRTQLAEARQKLDEIAVKIEKREELAEKIIDRRIADLLDDPDPYAWEMGAAETGYDSLPLGVQHPQFNAR